MSNRDRQENTVGAVKIIRRQFGKPSRIVIQSRYANSPNSPVSVHVVM